MEYPDEFLLFTYVLHQIEPILSIPPPIIFNVFLHTQLLNVTYYYLLLIVNLNSVKDRNSGFFLPFSNIANEFYNCLFYSKLAVPSFFDSPSSDSVEVWVCLAMCAV